MPFQSLMEKSPWIRGACLVFLLVFILVCGVHVAEIHHDSDSDGLGLVDRLAIILLVAVLGLVLIALTRKTSRAFSEAEPVRGVIFETAADPSVFGMVVPLRC
jgi:hypothetical protein